MGILKSFAENLTKSIIDEGLKRKIRALQKTNAKLRHVNATIEKQWRETLQKLRNAEKRLKAEHAGMLATRRALYDAEMALTVLRGRVDVDGNPYPE